MRTAFSLLRDVHALIHVMGFVKAFELAPLAPLKLPISRPMGVLRLAAAVLLLRSPGARRGRQDHASPAPFHPDP